MANYFDCLHMKLSLTNKNTSLKYLICSLRGLYFFACILYGCEVMPFLPPKGLFLAIDIKYFPLVSE